MNARERAAKAIEENAKQRAEWKAARIKIPESLGGGSIYRIEDLQWVVERKNKVLYYSDLVWCLKDVMRYAIGNGPDVKTLKDILARVKSVEEQIMSLAKEAYGANKTGRSSP